MPAPIVLFTYSRPQHTQLCIEALSKNPQAKESILYIYSDAPKSKEDKKSVTEVRNIIRTISGFKEIHIIEREFNVGLAQNIIDGVTYVVNKHEKVIILEDDLLVSPDFLHFMNWALDTYENESKVCHIHACDFTKNPQLPDTFLIKWPGSWGWATWKRAWENFNPNGEFLLHELKKKKLTKEFDFNNRYHFVRMLQNQTLGKNNSWAIRWNASLFLKDLLSLNVGKSLVENIGFDGTGTHCGSTNIFNTSIFPKPLHLEKIEPIEENKEARKIYTRYYRQKHSFFAKIKRRLQMLLNIYHP